ncbi:MAG: hypothetical protein RLZZ142_192 [Verrucomicrobiota bacterium]|jgi:hypothetical protein
MQLIQLVYASAANSAFSTQELIGLLEEARVSNAQSELTGLLLYYRGSFFQILEGPAEAVDAVYRHIEEDHRHHRLLLLSRKPIAERCFDSWSMGFVNVDHIPDPPPGFLEILEEAPVFLDNLGHSHLNLDDHHTRLTGFSRVHRIKTPRIPMHGNAKFVMRLLEEFEMGCWRQNQEE